MSNAAIVIPSYEPDERLVQLINDLVNKGMGPIYIVNDGSGREYDGIFCSIRNMVESGGGAILQHDVNRGKGRALKTAFEYVSEHFPETKGVITIDGDGQHLTKDIIACGEKLIENPDKVILGCRDFNLSGIPKKSLAGNKTTSFLFRVCCGIKLSDTQTGLRAVPAQFLEQFTEIEGERFEYETNMLLQMKRLGIRFVEQPIETVYDKEEYSSHYNALKDSWRIFKVMARFMAHKR